MAKLNDLLDAPCVFCCYNGQNYYQAGTHYPSCPWRLIGGLEERVEALPDFIRKMYERLNDCNKLVTLLRREVVEMDKRYSDGRK